MATAGTLEYIISVDSSKLSSGLNSAESKVKGFGDKVSAWSIAKGKLLGDFIKKAGQVTIGFVKDSISEGMSFDKAMSQVAATLGKSTEEVGELSKFARKMGAETAFSATEAAEALNYMALAGYDAQTSMKMLPTVLDLAAAGNIDLARASDMVTDAQSALGLSIEETEDLVDQMARTSSKTNTSVEQLGDAILTVGGTAKMLRGGTVELNAALGVLADNGIKGSEGGTALRNVLLSLTAPTDKAAKKLKQLGIEVFDADGNMRDLPTIMADINEATKDMTQQQRTEFLSDVFNKRDLKAVEALLGTTQNRWNGLYNEIAKSKGAAKQMAETQLDNLAGDVTKFKSALSEAKLTISDKLEPTLRKFVQRGTKYVGRLAKAFSEKGLKGAIQEAKTILKELVTEKLGLNADASFEEIGKKLIEKIKESFKNSKIKFAKLILGDDYNDEASWKEIGKKISGWLTGAFSEGGIIKELLDSGSEMLVSVAEFASQFIQGIADWISSGGGAQSIVDIVTAFANALAECAAPIVEALAKILTDPKIWEALGKAFEAVLNAIFGADAVKNLKKKLGIAISGEITGMNGLAMESAFSGYVKEWGDRIKSRASESEIQEVIDSWNSWAENSAKNWGLNEDQTKKFMEYFSWDKMLAKTAEGGDLMSYFNEAASAVNALKTADGELTTTTVTTSAAVAKLADAAGTAAFALSHVTTYNGGGGGGKIRLPSMYNQKLPGHDASGEWDVPYDEYLTRLHRNEMVLSASQARRYRNGEGEGNAELIAAVRGLRNDMQNMKLVVGKKVFGRAVVNYGGSRMSGYIGGADSRREAGYGT